MTTRRSFLSTTTLGAAGLTVGIARLARAGAGGGELHLALLSDTHLPGDRKNADRGFNPWENFQEAVPQVVAARPDGVVVCGDVARLEGRPEDYAELRALLAPVAAVAPVYVALGNHDDRDHFRAAFPEQPPGALAPVKARHVTVVEHPALRVIVLDSLLYVNQVAGLLGQAQRAWLEAALPASRPAGGHLRAPPADRRRRRFARR